MLMLISGLVIFFAVHAVPMSPSFRNTVTERIGRTGYQLMFSVVSLLGLLLIVWGYQASGEWNVIIWSPPVWTQHVATLLMLPALIALAAAYIPSNIRSALKHPMLVAIKVWAFAHLIANGDLVSMLLFGSFLVYGVVDRISVKRRGSLGPLGAAQGGIGGDIAAVVIGTGAYLFLLFYGHAWLFGVAPIPAISW